MPNNWTQLSPVSTPSPARFGFAIAYDKVRENVVLFGGYGAPAFGPSTTYSDTFIWDGTTWTNVSPATTPTDWSVGNNAVLMAAWDDVNQQVLLCYYGQSESPATFYTYLWDGTDWNRQFPANSPPTVMYPPTPNLYGCGISEAPGIGNVILFGGQVITGPGDETWSWDGSTWTQLSPATSPSGRQLPFMTYDSIRGEVVLFGGDPIGLGFLDDTWVWNGSTWTEKTTSTVGGAEGSSFAFDENCGYSIRFGGFFNDIADANKTFYWDGTDWTSDTPSPTPDPAFVSLQTMVYDAVRQQTLHVGGVNDDGTVVTMETWAYHCEPTPTAIGASINHVFGAN